MGKYVDPEDVQSRYQGGTLPSAWLELKIEDAEDLLFDHIPRLENSATERDIRRIKQVVAQAIGRLYDNPRGLIKEGIEEQSYELSRPANSDLAGTLYFTTAELNRFREHRVNRFGTLRIDPPWMSGTDV